MPDPIWSTAAGIAEDVAAGRTTATEVAERHLARIGQVDDVVNAFTEVTADRALAEAAEVDAAIARGEAPGPLAGVPFAVKNLFDIEGLTTLAGSKINRDRPPATADAVLIRRLRAAGAVLVGAVGMGEYAYDFTGENAHDGAVRNPHDPARMTGGSSSGSGAATAAGMAPITLGSDTNGSLRVPASLCGVFSLKPTYGRLPRTGTFGFVDSLDHMGPFARSVRDLALAYDAMQGRDAGDHGCTAPDPDPVAPALDRPLDRITIGVPGGWLRDRSGTQVRGAVEAAAAVLSGNVARISRPQMDAAEAGRAAAYLITASESAAFHLDRLRSRAADFDPDTRDRFLAGAMLPAAWVTKAQRVRAWWFRQASEVLRGHDALIVGATPFSAPLRGQKHLTLNGQDVPLRPNLGILAQPFSCIGLPVVTVPVFARGSMPVGVQIITRPWEEALALKIAARLERSGLAMAHPPGDAALVPQPAVAVEVEAARP